MNTKKLFLMMLATLLLGSSKAHETNTPNTIIRADKNELVQAGDFPDAFFNILSKMTDDFFPWTNNDPNLVPILVLYPEGAGSEAGVVGSALVQIRNRLYVHGIHSYNNDSVNPAKPYSC